MVVLALKKVRKKFTNHGVRKTTVSKLKKANLIYCNFRTYRHCQRPQRYKFPQRLRWSRRRRATMTLSCNIQMNNKTPALRKNKYYINTGGSFRHHNNCGPTHPSAMAASKENQFPPSFSGLILKISPWIQLWWGLRKRLSDYDEQSLNNWASVSFIFGCSKCSPDFKTAVTLRCLDTVFQRPYRYFLIALKVFFSLSNRYKIFTSNWLWIEFFEYVDLIKIDITMTTINKKLWNW